MWAARLLLLTQLLVCHLATDAPPAAPATAPAAPDGRERHTAEPTVSYDPLTYDPHPPVPAPAPSAPPSVMLRLGNSTIDSTKSFRVPQAASSASLPPSNSPVAPQLRPSPGPHLAPHVVPSGPHTHFHHDRRFGPTFDDGNITRITVQMGDDANLNCRISLLQDKTVSWVRRRGAGVPELLTVGPHTYAADARVSVARRYPGNWRLIVSDVRTHDEGVYECQISTHPPRVSRTYLHVNTPQVWVVDEAGAPLLEKYYEAESTLALVCRARDVDAPVVLSWLHEGRALNEDTTRGGISVRTEQVAGGADSTLRLARVNATDAGNYTCAVRGARPHTVSVHVLNEESLAELHAGAASSTFAAPLASTLTLSVVPWRANLSSHLQLHSVILVTVLSLALVMAPTPIKLATLLPT